jgi:hypothetical protein
MKKLVSLKKTAVIAAALFSVGAAQATLVDSSNNVLNFSWSYNTGSSTLTGYGSMTFSGFGSTDLTAVTSLTNTSLLSSERLTSFGFGIDPNATQVFFSDSGDGGMIAAELSTIPSLSTIEICAFGGQNCPGGANGGILGGASDEFTLLLKGTWGSFVDVAPIGFKYQTGYGSFEFLTSSGSSGSVPEPNSGALTLLGLGLLGASFAMRRRRSDQT